jgi:hypothetical protein
MESRLKQQKNPSNQQGLNPNWALLQQVLMSFSLSVSVSLFLFAYFNSFSLLLQKLHSHGSKPHRPSNNSLTETQKTILGEILL